MNLSGIQEFRPRGFAEALQAEGLAEGSWSHACSHRATSGALSLVSDLGRPVRIDVRPGDGEDPAEDVRSLLSASVLKLRCRGCGLLRLTADEAVRASADWDGGGWLASLHTLE